MRGRSKTKGGRREKSGREEGEREVWKGQSIRHTRHRTMDNNWKTQTGTTKYKKRRQMGMTYTLDVQNLYTTT